MANRTRTISLSTSGRQHLQRVFRAPSTPGGLSRRAHAVLLMHDNVPGVEIARRTGYSVVQVSRLRQRFAEHGVEGLDERRRPGRPRTITARHMTRVVALTLRRPPPGLTHWTAREMARRTGLSHVGVHRIWKAHGLKPHRVETFKFSKDPEAEFKIRDIVGLYLRPPDNAVVISLDEKTQIQALSRTQPLLPLREGLSARQTHDYRRNGLTSLFAAMDLTSGRVRGECRERHTAMDFLQFLKKVVRHYRREIHVVLDNSSTHKTPEVRQWLEAHPGVHFHFTPTGASWLNMIEAWFSTLTRKSIRRGSFDTVRGLVRHIRHYIDHWNENPVPFVWTKTADDIIPKAIRH